MINKEVILTSSASSSTPKRQTSFNFMRNNNSHSLYVPSSSSSLASSPSYLGIMEPSKTTLSVSIINPKRGEFVNETKIEKKASEDPEIGVFGAEKYFNGDMDSDQGSSVLSVTNVERTITDNAKKSTGTPSVRSESSWNSQSVLLQNKLVNSSLQEKKKNNSGGQIQKVRNIIKKKSFLANLGCKCACCDENSVDVKRSSDSNISVFTMRKMENQMSSSASINNSDLIRIQKKQEELAQRKSLEVFGSPVNIEKKKIVVQQKLSLLPWETRTEEEDKMSEGSDTSADLFEIESLTGKPKPFLTRQVSDPASSPTTTTCYAPSEVSVEWSIVTASAADFSVISECATSPVRRRSSQSQIPRIPITTKKSEQPQSSSGGSGFLLSCKSHKSVRVSGDLDSLNKNRPSYVPRFPMETTKPKSTETGRRISNSSIFHPQSSLLYIQ